MGFLSRAWFAHIGDEIVEVSGGLIDSVLPFALGAKRNLKTLGSG